MLERTERQQWNQYQQQNKIDSLERSGGEKQQQQDNNSHIIDRIIDSKSDDQSVIVNKNSMQIR